MGITFEPTPYTYFDVTSLYQIDLETIFLIWHGMIPNKSVSYSLSNLYDFCGGVADNARLRCERCGF